MLIELGNLATEPVSMSIGALGIGLISSIAPTIIGGLFGKSRSAPSGQQVSPELAAQSRAETELLKQRQKAIEELFSRAMSFDSTPVGRLDLEDSPFLDEDFLGSLRPTQDLDILKLLAGQGSGSGASGALASLQQRQLEGAQRGDELRGQAISSIIADLIESIGNRDSGTPDADPLEILNSFTSASIP